ncbi:hypothetical protein EB796_012907 [Bugula neritina]|uniref:Uncharacterized protein n=1 Tax=Bugula neritina TaxID=10212 RepID=A0A7J7JT06_BUGNE|nr:hypothetical protein EB796_012907 [Bugula neritina]
MGKKPKIGCIVSTLCFVAFTATIYYEFLSHHSIEGKLGLFKGGCLSLVFFLVGLLASDFTWRITSDYYSFKNLWIHYTSLLFLRLASFIFHRLVVKDTRNVRGVQEKFILDLIKSNA